MNPRDRREELFVDTVKDIQLAIKTTASYPEDHPTARQIVDNSYETLADLLATQATVTVCVFGDKVVVDDVPIDGKNTLFTGFTKDLHQRAIESITFYRGLSQGDFTIFLDAMIKRPGLLPHNGGVASVLKHHGVSTIRLNEVKYGKIAEEPGQLEDSHMLDYLRGESDTRGDYGQHFLSILEHDPRRVSDLIREVADGGQSPADPSNQPARAQAAVDATSRVATELVARQAVSWEQFKDTMGSVLSICDEDMLGELSRAMEVSGGDKPELIDGMLGELFYGAVAQICADGYRKTGQLDVKFLEGLAPCAEDRKRLLPHLRRKLEGWAGVDEEELIGELSGEEPAITEAPTHQRAVTSDAERDKIKDEIARLLSEGRGDEVNAIVRELSQRLDDTSWKIRKKVAESLLEVTGVLDGFDKLRENVRDLSEALIRRVKQENHSDIYLIASENLHKVCTSQNRAESYFTHETLGETLGRRLFEAHELSQDQLQKALMARKRNGKSLPYNLGAFNLVDEAVLTDFLAQQYRGCQIVNLSEIHDIPDHVLKAVPVKFVRDHLILPFRLHAGNLHTATINPNDLTLFNDLRFISGYSVVPHLAAEYHLLSAIERFYHIEATAPHGMQVMEEMPGEEEFELSEEHQGEGGGAEELKDSDAPVVRLVNVIIKAAITQKASDIHIEPYEDELRVRFRVDGTLTTLFSPSVRYATAITSRIKIMSGLDISERRLPQDGRFKIGLNGNRVDFRVSSFPGSFGEKVVLRLLDSSNLALDINNLGLSSNDLTTLLSALYKSKGMILVTGPTGSGKTTTLYSMIHGLNDGSRNISTAEDPIEYNLKGVNQFQMKPKIGLDFARALRTFLRQDPDIIMVGEIRDFETAEIAVKAALTGHLVLSTLHTNSAPETITRLLDMGIEPYLLTSSLSLVVAQRLMRKICPSCKVEAPATDLHLKMLEASGFDISAHQLFRGEGCEECNDTGYKGRVAVYEVMPLCQEIQEVILRGQSSVALREKAEDLGLVALPVQGLNKVIEGVTSLDEWMRAVA